MIFRVQNTTTVAFQVIQYSPLNKTWVVQSASRVSLWIDNPFILQNWKQFCGLLKVVFWKLCNFFKVLTDNCPVSMETSVPSHSDSYHEKALNTQRVGDKAGSSWDLYMVYGKIYFQARDIPVTFQVTHQSLIWDHARYTTASIICSRIGDHFTWHICRYICIYPIILICSDFL